MITPNHIQVLVERAENLKVKGNGETNNAFVIIQLANDKFTGGRKLPSDLPNLSQGIKREIKTGIFHRGDLRENHRL